MCIALPFNKPEQSNHFVVWQKISASPLKMLSLAGVIQLIISLSYWYVSPLKIFGAHTLILESQVMIASLVLLSIIPVFSYALLMHYYPIWLRSSSEIEYLQYASYFYLGNLNFMLIILANSWAETLLGFTLIFQLVLISHTFKPLRWLSVWARKQDKKLTQIINFLAGFYFLCCISFLISIFILFF